MAKFKNRNLDLKTGERIDFDDAGTIRMGYSGGELYINSTISGIRASQPYQMVRYDQLITTSGHIVSQIPTSHIELTDIGSTTHTGIDAHIADSNIHFPWEDVTDAITTATGSLTSDHGSITGLGDDDHTQYYNSTRLDTWWTTKSGQMDDHSELNGLDYASAGHTGFQPAGNYVTDSEMTTISGDLAADYTAADTVVTNAYIAAAVILDTKIDTTSGTLDTEKADTVHLHNSSDITVDEDMDFNNYAITGISGIGFTDGQKITWNGEDYTLNIPTGLGPVLQVGQEEYFRVHNATGSTLLNGTVVHPTFPVLTMTSGLINASPAIANDFLGVQGTIGVITSDILPDQGGLATVRGNVRHLNTGSLNPGPVWVSATVPGALTNTKPAFPDYNVSIGALIATGVTDGELIVSISSDIYRTTQNFWNGIFRESIDFRTSSLGGTVTGTLTPTNGHPNMTMLFSDGFTLLETTPPAEIVLVPGTDTNPQTNYVYVPKSTKVLTVSTSEWPPVEHIKVATIVLQSAATTVTDGALRNQNWNDHIQSTVDNQGHLSHIVSAVREKIGATWKSGAAATCTISGAETPDGVYISTTAGVVMQMYNQPFPASDTAAGSDLHIVNDNITPYKSVSNLSNEQTDAEGNSLNNRSFSFVLWGVGNKSGEASHLMINLPTGSYAFNSPEDAVENADNKSVYDIPAQFNGVGFLIARFTYTYKNDAWTLYDTEDLRGKIPNITAGGGAGGVGVTAFTQLLDTPSTYIANNFLQVNTGATALEMVTLTEADILDLQDYVTVSGLTVKKHVTIRPENVKLGAPGPAEAVIGNFSILQFTGETTTQSVYTSFHIPTDWSVGTDVNTRIHWAPIDTNSGTVMWQMTYDAVALDANEVISNVGTTVYITDDAQNTQDELLESSSMTISGTNLALEDTIGMTIFRDPTHGSDTYSSSASLVGIEIEYISDKLGESLP